MAYPFTDKGNYHINILGQKKTFTVLANGKRVSVEPSEPTSDSHIWTAIVDKGITHLQHKKTGLFLRNAEGFRHLEAQDGKPGPTNIFSATAFRTGYALSLAVEAKPKPIGIESNGTTEWPAWVDQSNTIFEIDFLGIK